MVMDIGLFIHPHVEADITTCVAIGAIGIHVGFGSRSAEKVPQGGAYLDKDRGGYERVQ